MARGVAGGLLGLRFVAAFAKSVSSSNGSGSEMIESEEDRGRATGLASGDTKGDVCKAWGMLAVVWNTKKASPPSPSFMA